MRVYFEPTSALDLELIKEVLDVMIEIADEGMAMICVSREMSFVKTVVDRALFMDGGKIIEEINTPEFLSIHRTSVRNYSLAKLSLTRLNLESSVGREKDEHTFVNQLRNPGSSVHDVI
jgi:ABC-type polar amino acid transport system ATPase subunit